MRDAAAVLSSHHYKTVTSKWSIEMVAIVGNVYYEIRSIQTKTPFLFGTVGL